MTNSRNSFRLAPLALLFGAAMLTTACEREPAPAKPVPAAPAKPEVTPPKTEPTAPAKTEAAPPKPAPAPAKTEPAPTKPVPTPVPPGAQSPGHTHAEAPNLAPPAAPAAEEQPPLPAPYFGPNKPIEKDAKILQRITTPNNLVLEDFRIGDGGIVLPKAVVWYKSVARIKGSDKPFEDNYATDNILYGNLEQLLPGVASGMVGMKVGGQRRIHIPSGLGFGWTGRKSNDNPDVYVIPPDSDLVIDVEVMGVKSTFVKPGTETPKTDGADAKPDSGEQTK